ncbi:unnamed protein product [Peniophora sp. CBMAI 1063]|nr:unnamed protein product [Peniophora sp. CBMAI 1063]
MDNGGVLGALAPAMGEASTTNRALKREHSPDIDLGSLAKRARTAESEPDVGPPSAPPRAPTPTLPALHELENERPIAPRDLRRRQTAPLLDLSVRLEQLPFHHPPQIPTPRASPSRPRTLTRARSRQSLSFTGSFPSSTPTTPLTHLTFFDLPPAPSGRSLTPSAFSYSSDLGLHTPRSLTPFSTSSIPSTSSQPTFPDTSARYHLRPLPQASAIPFAPTPADDPLAHPLAWTQTGMLAFGRGARVHLKPPAGETITLAKLSGLRLLCAGDDRSPDTLALASASGTIQIWDVKERKMVRAWKTRPVTALGWANGVLAVGGEKGTIRHFDARAPVVASGASSLSSSLGLSTASAVEGNAIKKVTRHQARIGVLSWNHDGRVLASGDAGGVIHAWDSRMAGKGPLDVGEQIMRNRRKMACGGPVKALSWCPWSLKTLASGDGSGVVRLWTINEAAPKSPANNSLSLGAQVTSLVWSSQCKELLSTHGAAVATPSADSPSPPSTPDLSSLNFNSNSDWAPNSPTFSVSSFSSTYPASTSSSVYNSTLGLNGGANGNNSNVEKESLEDSVAVHSFPALGFVASARVGASVRGSALAPGGTRVAISVPDEKVIKFFDVWSKARVRGRASMTEGPCGIR